jgi:hypothetical protein
LSAVTLVGYVHLKPFVQDLEKTYDIICGGDRDFVVTSDITGRPWATRANPFGEDIPPYEQILANAVGEAIDGDFNQTLLSGKLSWGGYHSRFGSRHERPIDDVERLKRSSKKDKFTTFYQYSAGFTADGKFNDDDAAVVHLRTIMQNDSIFCDGISSVTTGLSCYQTWGDNVETTLRIQAVCPEGCGCNSVYEGTIYKQLGGCPVRTGHSEGLHAELASLPCEDPSAHSSSSTLQQIRTWMAGPEVQQFCDYVAVHDTPCLDPSNDGFCEIFHKHFHILHTIMPAICPVRFGCKHGNVTDANLLFCPSSCPWSHRNATG